MTASTAGSDARRNTTASPTHLPNPVPDAGAAAAPRVPAVDVARGLVMLLLLPDLYGGFSFNRVAPAYPDSEVWAALARQFTHAEWLGGNVWDLVMPVFVFVVGMSALLSFLARTRRGESHATQTRHTIVRSIALVLLGLAIQLDTVQPFDRAIPYLLLALGLPIVPWIAARLRLARADRVRLEIGWQALVLSVAAGWMLVHVERLGDYQPSFILIQLGLASLAAWFGVRASVRSRLLGAASLLLLYGLAFVLYTPGPDAVRYGVPVAGYLGDWSNGSNVVAMFDRWLLNALPRAMPFDGDPRGYHTLEFIPLIAVMLVGMSTAEVLYRSPGIPGARRRVTTWGIAAIAAGLLLSTFAFPLIKRLYTPSWAALSIGIVILLVVALDRLVATRIGARMARPLMVLGTNTVLLYTIVSLERWRFIEVFYRISGVSRDGHALLPLFESLFVLAAMWILAWLLLRARIRVSL